MPFVQRVVEPKYLSRRSLHGEGGQPLVTDYELEAVTNNTLSSALRQLASLVLIANDIFEDLSKQLQDVCERSKRLRTRIAVVEEKVVAFDPKKVTVPESDLTTFSLRTKNFSSCKENTATKNLFCATTRPDCVRRLYESAAKTPVHVMRQLDRYRRDGRRSSRYFLCTPVLGGERRSVAKIKHKPGIDIETRMPAVVNELRRWTSEEAIGDITVTPDCASRIASSTIDAETVEIGVEDDTVDAGTDHRLPSPEEQIQTVALRFPAEVVAVDVSGRAFDRMTSFRRSLMHVQVDADGTVRRRHKKPRGRRRNTIAGTDQRELEQAVTGESPNSELPDLSADAISVVRSASSDLLRSKDDSPSEGKKSHFNTLKQWGKVKLKLIRSVSGESSKTSTLSPDEANIYETVGAKGKKGDLKHDKKSSKAAGTNIPISTSSGAMNMAVKLREGSVRRRALINGKEDPLHSSSGNWSASSESGRASVGSENTVTTHQPKSTTTLSSAATSSNSLHHQPPSSTVSSRRKFLNTSASSSISEGTLTPDIMSDLMSPFPDDGETSSIYSCDTEGYYTSFHLDSGLKTLKEEETSSPQTPLHSTTALSTSPGRSNTTLTAENEYELFGKGSTSTTTSSAGTVCTTLLVGENNLSVATAPAVPERKSSLEGKDGKNSQMVIAMIHKQTEGPSESPDSGHNTSSSPVDSTNSPPGTLTGRSSEYEFSESDLEGVDRIERIRVKTTINSSRIPSMCVITPPQSDDETSQYVPSYYSRKYNTLTLHDRGSKQFNVESYLQGEDNYSADNPQSRYNSLPRSFEKQLSTDSDRSSEPEPTKVRSRSACRSVTSSGYGSVKQFERSASLKARVSGPSPSPTRKAITSENAQKSNNQQNKVVPTLKSSFQPLNNMIGKVKGVLSHAGSGRKNSKSSAGEDSDNSPTESKVPSQVDAGDYVTIADVRNNTRNTAQNSNTYANTIPHSTAADKLEYVSLNELPTSVRPSSPSGNPLTAPFDSSLERKRRQGARVTLDSEGKVVYSSDSLKRNKGAHTTFEPGPCVRDLSTTPAASPIPSHRIPKSNIRPVIVSNQQGRTSPSVAGGTKSPVNQRNRSTSLRQRVSPTSPTSPQLGKVIIRAGSKTTPMTRVASPPLAVASRPMSPKPSVASGRGAYVHMQSSLPPGGRSANPPASSPNEHDEDRTSQGYASPRRAPPKYVSPPPAHPSHWPSSPQSSIGLKQQYPQSYWTLPARKPQNYPGVSAGQETVAVDTQRNGRFNTIATSGRSPNYAQNYPPYNDVRNYYGNALSPPNGACHSSQLRTPYPPGQSTARSHLGSAGYSQYPPSASITTTQRNDSNRTPTRQESRNIFFSSTPTKKEKTELLYQNDSTMMNLGKTFSPIEKSSRQRELERMAADSKQQQNRLNSHSRSATPCLLSPPKTSMTSEEIFAAIHKSKKRMNIKTDSDSFSRSNSPSLSSVTSISPGSSESSVNCIGRCITPVKNAPEVGSFQGDNSPGSRHSWSPNSGEYYDFYSRFEHRSPSPVISPGSRQSWACDRLGPRQQTSRNDFKRLLLQQGTKLNPNTLTGSSSSRISAVEQLRLTRHQKLGTVTSNGMISNSYTPRSPVDKKIVSSKLLQSPRSNTGWRFASPRSDVLSSTILEDCAEEEKASCSPQHSPTVKPAHQTQQMTLSNSSVRRPLNLSFNSNVKQESNTEPQIYQDKTNTSHTITRDSSPRTITKCLSNNLSSMKFLTSECASHNNPSLSNGSLHSRELLSPSNVKENVNTNLQRTGDNTSRGSESSLKQSLNRLILHSPSPRINMLLAKQRNSQYASHGTTARSILGALTSAKSPPKATLETAL